MTSAEKTPRASILAIGTELTSGQTLNTNAQWISQRLDAMGMSVTLHETVPDDHALIVNALERCAAKGDLVFVTGGLGPTTDDFTREVISKWTGKPLEFDEDSWQSIVTRFKERGTVPAPSNRQQCYFPQGSQILENPAGTANGFHFEHLRRKFWVLPGPPREGHAVWDLHLEPALKTLFPGLRPEMLKTWNCLGKSEAELGELTEIALKGAGLKTGYRAHIPYIEIKVWIPAEIVASERTAAALARLEKAIEPWVVTRDKEDLAENFLNALKLLSTRRFVIQDGGTFGYLAERLAPKLREKNHRALAKAVQLESRFHPTEGVPASALATSTYQAATFTLENMPQEIESDPREWKLSARFSNDRYETILLPPYRGKVPIERLHKHLGEVAIKTWLEWINLSLDQIGEPR